MRQAAIAITLIILSAPALQADDYFPDQAKLRSAIENGLKIVQKGAMNYPSHRKCFSCHHQTLPMLAMKSAREAGFKVDEEIFQQQLNHTRKFFTGKLKNLKSGSGIGGKSMTVSYALWTLDIAENDSDELSSAMVTYLLKTQEKTGRWSLSSNRPPMGSSKVTSTVLSAYFMEKLADDSQQTEVVAAVEKANAWLGKAKLDDTEAKVMRLWGMHQLGGRRIDVMFAQRALFKDQRDDGGWAQLPDMKSDAYATGQALYILRETGWPTWSPEYQRGIQYLLKTQEEDGSWFVKTRAKPVQVYFDNGDPHGKSQFISIPATSWAVATLAGLLKDLSDQPTITLWPNGAPGAVGTDSKDIPTISVYTPPAGEANGAAVVVCPGGGYGGLAIGHEGHDIGEWFNSFGVTAFVLQYRHAPNYKHPIPLQDAQRALRTVRTRAKEWNLDTNRIGIMGFSAGGHLASTAGTHFDKGKPDAKDPIDRASSRPDFLILCYPVISFASEFTHKGSRRNLLGDKPEPKLVENLSNETQVTKETPPTFLFHTSEDKAVPPQNSILFYLALRKAGIPAEMHIYEHGRHGLGLATNVPAVNSWSKRCEEWLQSRGILKKP